MQLSDLNASTPGQFLALVLIFALLAESLRAWVGLARAYRSGRPWLAWNDETRATWRTFFDGLAILLTLVLLALMLSSRLADTRATAVSPDPDTLTRLINSVIVTGGTVLLLLAILVSNHNRVSEYGFRLREPWTQIKDGYHGFLLAILPTALLMNVTAHLRNRQNQNALLTLLADTSDPWIIVLIVIAAVITAPLSEEMMFRVILQGWLTSRPWPSEIGILATALAFASVHGIPDSIALLPLAIVLGTVFYRRHSYLSVVVIHALFNGTMLTLAMLTRA